MGECEVKFLEFVHGCIFFGAGGAFKLLFGLIQKKRPKGALMKTCFTYVSFLKGVCFVKTSFACWSLTLGCINFGQFITDE